MVLSGDTWSIVDQETRDLTELNCTEIAEVEGISEAIRVAFNDGADAARKYDKEHCTKPDVCTCLCGSASLAP